MKRADIILQNSRKFWQGINQRENVAPYRSERKTQVQPTTAQAEVNVGDIAGV